MSQPSPPSLRLLEVDALRGLAAITVVAFHYTTQFRRLFDPQSRAWVEAPWGHYGVNLFFIISGFVIFMTLDRTRRPMDFVVSRFSRLFPAYWLALLLTFSITHALGLPGKLVAPGQALANAVMVHGLFGVPHVDSVYWTLEIELLFYAGMFTLYRLGQLSKVHWVVSALLLLRIAYHLGQAWGGVTLLPWAVVHLLILSYLPWFALGISVYLALNQRTQASRSQSIAMASLALLALAVAEGPGIAALAVALGGLVLLAAAGRARFLAWPPLVWLGAISYPLYLLHENIGWAVLLRLRGLGVETNLAIALTLVLALLLAQAVHRWVEMPAMHWIRQGHRRRAERAKLA